MKESFAAGRAIMISGCISIEIMEKDKVPVRLFKGPLMRSKYNIQTPFKEMNRQLDYLIYTMDGKISLMELSVACNLNFEYVCDICDKLEKDGILKYENCSVNNSKG